MKTLKQIFTKWEYNNLPLAHPLVILQRLLFFIPYVTFKALTCLCAILAGDSYHAKVLWKT